MSLLDAADPTLLINSLANPLAPDARPAFRAAAEQALAGLSCWGEGVGYRTVAPLQKLFFVAPNDERMHWDVSLDQRTGRRSKLIDAPAIGPGRSRDLHYSRRTKAAG
jgi:hypothetical protein